MENKTLSVNPPKRRSLPFRIIKSVLVGIASILLLLVIFGTWIYFSLIAGPGPMEMNEFHPFRSEKARVEYYAFEEQMTKSWPIHSEERIVETSLGKTFMRISGPEDGPTLILLPGGGSNSLIWHANIKALSEVSRTYALDNIYDYGRSIYTQELETGQDLAFWLDELSDSLHLGHDISMIGYSYGGWVVSQFALYHPERLKQVVLIAPAATVLPLPKEYIVQMLKTMIPLRYYKKKIMYWVWKDLAEMGEWGQNLVEERIDYYQLALKSFKFKQPVNPTVLAEKEFAELSIPVLFLVGENETVYNAHEAVDRLNNVNPEIQTELISNTGHDLMFTHTDKINSILLDFLRE